jgi:beta-galactosidase
MLKIRIIALLILVVFCVPSSYGQNKTDEDQKNKRIEKILNSQWTFNYFPNESADNGYESVRFDDSAWPIVSIPHTWNSYETTGELHPFIRNASESDNPYWWIGWGWYRKHFSVNSKYSDRKVFIEFEGVQKYCKVWINGKYLGEHKGGYGSFDFDLTPYIKSGADNVLAVAVRNLQNDDFKIPPMSPGKFDLYGGIYRDVTLVLKNSVYIPMQGSAVHEGGTFVSTPVVSEKEGVARIRTWVKNDNNESRSCILQTSILDASGKIIQVIKTNADINPGQIYEFDQMSKPVKRPHLWSVEDPYLYSVISELIYGKEIVDNYTSPLGFRRVTWNYKDNSLLINGSKMLIHGGNLLQEYPWLGGAVNKWIMEMDINDISHNLNYNFLRTAYYPNDKVVYDLTDKYGLAVVEETPSIMDQDFGADIQEQQMKEMIRRDRNHPSIIFWNMGNETDHAVDSKFAEAEDTTRILIANLVTNGSAGAYVKLTDKNLAFESLPVKTVRGWYNSDVMNTDPADSQSCGTEESQENMLIASGLFGKGNLCTWIYEDHGTGNSYLNSPIQHVDPAGYVDIYRVPKYAYYFWQANYSEKPMVFVQPHYWRSQYRGQNKDIVVNSNCDKVELKVNGESKGSLIPDEANFHSVTFKDITVEKGTLTATGSKNGSTVTNRIVMAGEPAKIILSSSHTKMTADRASVAIITADIVDQDGNHVYGASNTIKWAVTGPAKFVGPKVYESEINKQNKPEGVWYMDMPVSNVIRSTGRPGKIHVAVYASGLASGSVDIDAEVLKPDNSIFNEPVLDTIGRNDVIRLVIKVDRLEETRREIKFSNEGFKMDITDKKGYIRGIRDYIFKNNPDVDSTTIEFRALVNVLASQLLNNKGEIIADDYNFNVDHFNDCRLIYGYITATKLPPLFKDGLRNYYADEVIKRGSEKDAGDEMNWLNWIPSGGTVVYSVEASGEDIPKGTKTSKSTDLPDLIELVYPVYRTFSNDAKVRALTFIDKMNPYVKAVNVNDENREGDKKKVTTIAYKAEKGKPILIPELKFIAE